MYTENAQALDPSSPLAYGTWIVDRDASELGFTARGTFGLVKVKGTFGSFNGSLIANAKDISGKLAIQAASLNTGNERRDQHLRSDDFFAAARYPEVLFELTSVTSRSGGRLDLAGVLQVKETRLKITAPLDVRALDEHRVGLSTQLSVDRGAIGLTWNHLGIIRGGYRLHASVELVRAQGANELDPTGARVRGQGIGI